MEILNSSKLKSFPSVASLTALSFLLLLVFLLSNFSPTDYSSLFSSCPSPTVPAKDTDRDGLPAALQKAAEGNNKTVIIAVINKAYVERIDDDQPSDMLDLFLESFWLGEGTRPLINHLLVVAADRTAYERCVFRGLHCHLLEAKSDGPSPPAGEQVYMSKGFIDFMWRRTSFLLAVLREGYSFIFTDTDVMWLRNPFTRLDATNHTNDIEFSTDWFNGHPKSGKNQINTGFYWVQSNNRTISLFERWYDLRHKSGGMKEQDVLQGMIRRGTMRALNLTVRFLDTRRFSGFCQDSNDLAEVVTVHANCCRYISAKVKDLAAVLADWKRFKTSSATPSSSRNGTTGLVWSPHVHCRKSWEHN